MAEPQLVRDVLAEDALLVTPEEAAALLRVGRTTVYALMRAGHLRPVHIGRSCRLPRSELNRYVDGLRSSTPERALVSERLTTDTGELHSSVHSSSDDRRSVRRPHREHRSDTTLTATTP